jgi:hypothetical protein
MKNKLERFLSKSFLSFQFFSSEKLLTHSLLLSISMAARWRYAAAGCVYERMAQSGLHQPQFESIEGKIAYDVTFEKRIMGLESSCKISKLTVIRMMRDTILQCVSGI